MTHLPNFPCTEKIYRSSSSGSPLRVQYTDRLRLEVAVVGGREQFAWPGASSFEREQWRRRY